VQALLIKLRSLIDQFEQNISEEEAIRKMSKPLCFINSFTIFIAITGTISLITIFALATRSYGNPDTVLIVGSYLAAGYLLILVVYLIVSFIGLYRVMNHLFDGNLSDDFKLLRTTYFLMTTAFFVLIVYFALFFLYEAGFCNRFLKWEL